MDDKRIITFEVDAAKVARIASKVRTEQLPAVDAQKFLDLFASDIEEALTERLRQFVVGKFEKRA